MKRLFPLLLLLASCSPTVPEVPSPPPPANNSCVISGGQNNTCTIGNGNNATPSPSPGTVTGPFPRPDYVKITQFGETCPIGIEPSGIDRSVRIGCSKALTLSPKCRQVSGPDIDCPVPPGAEPSEFKVIAGADHIAFSDSASSKFNRDAKGVTEGQAIITGSYGGVAVEPGQEFTLTVIR